MKQSPPAEHGGEPTDRFHRLSRTRLRPAVRLDLSLLGDFERVVDLNPNVSDSAFELGVAEQQLNRPEILGSP